MKGRGRRDDNDAGISDKMQPSTCADAVHRSDHGFGDPAVPGGEAQLGTLGLTRVGLQRFGVAGELDDIEARLKSPAVAGVHDDRHRVVGCELGPRGLRSMNIRASMALPA